MSKILDRLRSEKDIESVRERLAEIYISPAEKKSLSEQKNGVGSTKKINKDRRILLSFLTALCLALFVLLFSNNKLIINISFVREETPQKSTPTDKKTELVKTAGQLPEGLHSNTIEFGGAASRESRITDEYIYLSGDTSTGWANARIGFDKPVNALNRSLSFEARGERGGEKLGIMLKDKNNKAYQFLNAAGNGLSREWQKIEINLQSTGRWIDLGSIVQMNFEFGKVTMNNPLPTRIYLKNIKLDREKMF